MKLPSAVTLRIGKQMLKAQRNAPSLLFFGGLAGVTASTVLACRATLQLEDTLDEIHKEVQDANIVYSTKVERDYNPSESTLHKELAFIYIQGAGRVAFLYGPSVVLGLASVAALTKSHSLLQQRNLAITAAYAAVDEALKKYRANVVEVYGEERDRTFRHESETAYSKEGGMERAVHVFNRDRPPSEYAKLFDQFSTYWSPEPEYNMAWLKNKEDWFNKLLHMKGFVYLNEVYDELDIELTEAGRVVGWVSGGDGDSYIDFGIFSRKDGQLIDFVNGREAAVLLDFNVDGIIYDKIDDLDCGGFKPWQR